MTISKTQITWLIFGGVFTLGMVVAFWKRKAIVDYIFNEQQESSLSKLNSGVQNNFRRFVQEVQQKLGYNVLITSSYRSYSQQASEYAENSSNSKPGYSPHNFGIALDINLVNQKDSSKMIKKASSAEAWRNTGIVALAKKYGMRWGGEFENYYDPVHFDFANIYPTAHLHDLAVKQFGNDWGKIQGNKLNLKTA